VPVTSITPQMMGKSAAYWTDMFPALTGTSWNVCGSGALPSGQAARLVQLTQSGHDSAPEWSPDGLWIAS